jgi:hypothetical protein
MKLKYFIPLAAFMVPTWVITYFRWPAAFSAFPDQGTESLTGLVVMWVFVGVNYYLGIRSVVRDRDGA